MQAEEEEAPLSALYGAAIGDLARETGLDPEHVKALYERELAQLEANAKVRGFLPVLASRKVRMVLRRVSDGAN